LSPSVEPRPPIPPAASPSAHRRGALWPWLVTPLVTLALFYLLHNERKHPPADYPVPATRAP